jgi:DNA helicase-2/ATP-dependent DNA helicase PcrA
MVEGNRRISRSGGTIGSGGGAWGESSATWERPRRESGISAERRAAANRERMVDAAIAAGGNGSNGASRNGGTLGLRIGDDVRHAKWGEGVVIDLEGGGDKAEIVVRFPDAGEKRLLLAWAPLQKI